MRELGWIGIMLSAGQLLQKLLRRVNRAFDEVRSYISFHHLGGPRKLKLRPDDVILVCLIKNGAFWLETFMKHYTELGISHFVFVDNGSTDNTVNYLLSKDSVTVVRSTLPVKHYESYLRRHAIRKFATGNWCLCVDSDELFDYNHSDKLPLRGLIGYLGHEGYTCVVAQMLDMFPEGQIDGEVDETDFVRKFNFYDLSGIRTHTYHNCADNGFDYFARNNTVGSSDIRWLFGGIRATRFNTNVCLTKHPLIRVSPSTVPSVHPHCSSSVKCADISALIRHYKFAGDFRARVKSEVKGKTWESGEPEKYLLGLETSSKLILKSETSRCFSGTSALVADGFLVTSEKFERWVKQYEVNRRSDSQ
jgi:hypothetical protein